MSEDDLKVISKVLRRIATLVEDDPHFLHELDLWLKHYSDSANTAREVGTSTLPRVNVFEVYSTGGMKELDNILEQQDVVSLRKIIQNSNLDPSKLSHKWKDKERLVRLIKERVSSRANKGDVFMHYDSDSTKSDRDHK